ncbi:flagellar hook-associated protein FlgK [Pseudomonadota bacterium]
MASLLNTGLSGLLTFQRKLDTTSHNVTNVDTPGYSRQRVLAATNTPNDFGQYYIGTGSHVAEVERVYDELLVNQLRFSTSATAELDAYSNYISRLDSLFADPSLGLDPVLQDFFDAVQGLADDPSSQSSRQLLLADSQTLTERFDFLYGRVESTRNAVNQDVEAALSEINALASAVAKLNNDISSVFGDASGAIPNDLLDERDQLVLELSELVGVSVLEQDNGALNVFIGSGQALVIDDKSYSLQSTISAADPADAGVGISYGSGVQDITLQISGGRLGGLIDFRGDTLNSAENQLGLVAVGVAAEFNAQHRLGLDLNDNQGGDFFSVPSINVIVNSNNADPNLNVITANYDDISNLTAADYQVRFDGGANNTYTLTNLLTGSSTSVDAGAVPAYPVNFLVDGVSVDVAAGATVGDTFLVQPTRGGANNIELLLSDPNTIAAAGALRVAEATDATGVPTNTGTASFTQPTASVSATLPLAVDMTFTFSADADGGGNPGFVITNGPVAPNDYILYDPATESGGKAFPESGNPTQFDGFGGFSFDVAGVPVVGDVFTVSNNSGAAGDNRNALSLAALQNENTLNGDTTSFQETYSLLVSDIGASTRRTDINLKAQEGLLNQAIAEREAVSGVNLDEEAANLLKYQQAYQAAAQVIAVSDTLFNSLLAAVRR